MRPVLRRVLEEESLRKGHIEESHFSKEDKGSGDVRIPISGTDFEQGRGEGEFLFQRQTAFIPLSSLAIKTWILLITAAIAI